MVLERPNPGDVVWRCRKCGKTYQAEEINRIDPVCRDIVCRGALDEVRI